MNMNTRLILGFVLTILLALTGIARAEVELLYYEGFDGSSSVPWTASNNSVDVNYSGGYLYIGANGVQDDGVAEREFSIDLSTDAPIVIEQRLKLESDGLNYRLPSEEIVFEDSSELAVTYLPGDPPENYGWLCGGWTGITEPEVPGAGWWTSATADYWTITKFVMTATGGQLFMKPDDLAKGWHSDEFQFIASTSWSHSQITKIRFSQPWDSVNYIDYISIHEIPEPATLSLLALGGLALIRRRRK